MLVAISGGQTAKEYLDRGEQAFNKNDDETAIVDFTKAIKLDPTAAFAYYGRGMAYSRKASFDLAIADFTILVNSKITSSEIYSERGFDYFETHDNDLALADLDKAVELDKTSSEAYYRRGLVYAGEGKYDLSIADYSKAIELRPTYFAAYYFRADAYELRAAQSVLNGAEDTRNYDLAISDYRKASELNPKDTTVLNKLGGFLSDDLAIGEYNRVLVLDPENAEAYHGRASIYYRMGHCAAAFADLNKLIPMNALFNKYGADYRERGWVNLCLNNGSAAYQDAVKALELNSSGIDAPDAVMIGYFGLRERGDKTAATAFLETWINKSDPKVMESYIMRYLHGDLTADYLLATAKDDKYGWLTEAHGYIGMNLALAGDQDPARVHFEWVKTQGKKGYAAYYLALNQLNRLQIPAAVK
ncbi:MAG: tetratricopeptide repeat protein [Pyrinomonadaceae bacterium]